MSKNVKIALVVVGLAALIALLVVLRRDKTVVESTAAKIEDKLDELDPGAAAEAVAKFGAQARDKAIEAAGIAKERAIEVSDRIAG